MMVSAKMCMFREVSQAYENSVLGMQKTDDPHGSHRIIFSGNKANIFFSREAGAVDLLSLGVLTQVRLKKDKLPYLATTDLPQAYNRTGAPD